MSLKINKTKVLSYIVLALGIIAVLYYIIIGQKSEFDSDFTDTVIWAKAMLTGNGLFDKSMSYAYTLPFGGSLLMAPFVAIFGMSYKAHVLGFILFFAILVISLLKMFGIMEFTVSESSIMTGLVLLLSLPSKEVRMTIWGHVIHYSLGFLFVVIGLVLFSKINCEIHGKEEFRKQIIPLLALAIFTALCCTNGLTIILFFMIPFYGAIVIERFIDIDNGLFCKKNIGTFVISVVCVILGGFGYIVSKIIQRDVITVYDSMFKEIPMWQHWVWDITERLRTFIICTCGEVSGEVPMESFQGIRILYMALVALVIIVVPFIAALSYKKMNNKFMRVFLISYFILLFSTLFVFDFSVARGTAHRLVGIYMTAVTVSVIYMMWLIKNAQLMRFGFVIAAIFSIASLFCMYSVSTLRYENRFSRLAQVLEENGLKYGYAEYWSAQVTTVLSDNNVELASININEDGIVSENRYNTFEYQFADRTDADKYFLFLSSWEYDTIKDTVGKNATKLIEFDEDGYILVFDENIF